MHLEETQVERMREAVEEVERQAEAKNAEVTRENAELKMEVVELRRKLEEKKAEADRANEDVVRIGRRNEELVQRTEEQGQKHDRQISDLRASFTEQLRLERLRHQRSRDEASSRLQKLKNYVDYQGRIKARYLASNQLYGNLRFVEHLEKKENIVLPGRIADGLKLKKASQDEWLEAQEEVELQEGDFVLPAAVSDSEARDETSGVPPYGVNQYGSGL